MIDDVKDYLTPKRFGLVSYVCLILYFLCGVILTAVTNEVRKGEFGKFSCAVDKKSTAAYKAYIEKTCYSKYEQTYNSPLPLYGFVLLSFGLTVFVSVVYSLAVSSRVDEIADRIANGREESRTEVEATSRGFYVFYRYFFHLVVRSLFGIVFTVLQHIVFYPRGFDIKFSCGLPTTDVTSHIAKNSSVAQINVTSITCENSTAWERKLWGTIVSILHPVLALIILLEVIYLCPLFSIHNRRFEVRWISDTEFIKFYLLRKRYPSVDDEQTGRDNNSPLLRPMAVNSSTPDINNDDPRAGASFGFCIEFYKQQVLKDRYTPDIRYKRNTEQGHTYIDIVFHTGRAQHEFTKKMDRHEIYDVYTEVPFDSTRLEEVKDLFYPNEDTEHKFPRTILAVGRPGIGKTVLTEKIIHDWAKGVDEFYHGKIAFSFKFRWFNFEELKDTSLKTFLRFGTDWLDEEKFEIIFEQILSKPEKGIFIFDGLDEFNGNFRKCLDESRMGLNDAITPMSPMTLFIKLVTGKMLPGATILVTSRPTAEDLYSKLHFDRTVEIIGFTSYKIEDYVGQFCEDINRSDLKSKIWNHIQSSSDLLNLCYIPVNCYIVCFTLSGCLSSSGNSTGALPTTLTSLYQKALTYFGKHHDRNVDDTCSKQMLKKLQEMAFRGMENGQLVFKENLFDEQMRTSGLVNCLTNPTSSLETQFCFIHLTIQEFLAAKHVIETLAPDEIETFISTHIKSGKWHLVLRFIAGLLGEEIKMSGSKYQDCVLAFAKGLTLRDGVINLDDYGHVLVIKCLREVNNKRIVKNVCETSDMSNARSLQSFSGHALSSRDWMAVTYVCKHLNKLIHLHLQFLKLLPNDIYFREACELVQQKCFESLNVTIPGHIEMEGLIRALTNSKCELKHEHAKLRRLEIDGCLNDSDVSNLCTFIKHGHANNLQVLGLRRFRDSLSYPVNELWKVVNDDKLCGELTCLNVGYNVINELSVGWLCSALRKGHCKINKLVLTKCSLTAKCVLWLSSVLCDEHCQLTDLSLDRNFIRDEGVRMLCTEALGEEHCKLTKLSLSECRLTDKCVPRLCENLQDRNCRLVNLTILFNDFTEQGKSLLRDVQEVEICKARGLKISV